MEEGSGVVIGSSGNRLPTKSVLFCRMTPFIITEDGDIENFAGGKVDNIYQADDQYFQLFQRTGQRTTSRKRSEYNY